MKKFYIIKAILDNPSANTHSFSFYGAVPGIDKNGGTWLTDTSYAFRYANKKLALSAINCLGDGVYELVKIYEKP